MAAVPPVDDPTIKKITLSPTNAESIVPSEEGAKPNNKTRRRNKKNVPGVSANTRVVVTKDLGSTTTTAVPTTPAPTQAAGAATSPGTFVQLASTHVPGSNSSKAVGATSGLTAAGAPVSGPTATGSGGATTGSGAAAATSGGASKVRVVLAKSHKKKVLLAAPKPAAAPAPAAKRKTAKKIHVSLKGLGSGLRRAKTIRKKASKHTLADIKKALTEAKLIKADSKAPEDILRQMYADYMVLKKKAL